VVDVPVNFAVDARVSPVHVTVNGPAATAAASVIVMVLVANDAVDAAVVTPQNVVAGATLEITEEGNASVICPPDAS